MTSLILYCEISLAAGTIDFFKQEAASPDSLIDTSIVFPVSCYRAEDPK